MKDNHDTNTVDVFPVPKKRGRRPTGSARSGAQRTAEYRARKAQVLAQTVPAVPFLSEFGGITDDEANAIRKFLADSRNPNRNHSLHGFYQNIIDELGRVGVPDAVLVDVDTLYRFAVWGL
ncbi:hypothetical protein KFZ76_13770 [Methylovulum psychrotolerans]|uniref:hypothetical protein n=1 Tax=Methylovulum psychrotolerans TaxID=1704499 RepID=UPI001BFF5031|nr:hypothetical protein [Methylovulum psychrotolerans]MBT9098773.1 hypothetical protein [Methylovulum psychrotolerans]